MGEVVTIKSGASPSSFCEGNILYIKVDDLNYSTREQYQSYMKVKTNEKAHIVKEGSIIFPKRGAAIMTNKVRILAKTGYMDTNMMALEPNDINGDFLYMFIYKTGLYKIADTSTIPQINNKHIEPYEILLPKSEEQIQIGNFFKNLDNLITFHQRKCQISIKHFKTWEQRKLGDLCQITMGQSPDGSTYSDEPSDYILVQGNADLKDGWVVPRIWTTQKTKSAQAGDLIMSVRAPAGAMGKTAYDAVIGRGVAAIKGNEFIYQSLVKYDSDGYWKKLAAGSTFESVNSNVVKGALISVPQDIEEQVKIGEYFHNLDNLITFHRRAHK